MIGQATIRQTTDIAEMVAIQPQWRLRYEQLSAGRYAGRVVHASLEGLLLTQETSSKAARQQGSLSERHVGLALAHGVNAGVCRFHGQVAGRDVAMVGLGHELDLTTPDDCELLALLMPRAAFFGMLSQWHPGFAEKARSASLTVQLHPGQASRLKSLMRTLLRVLASPSPQQTQAVVRQLQDTLVLAWQDALTGLSGADFAGADALTLARRRRLVDRACQLVRDSLLNEEQKLPTMLDLCHVLGTSPRKLAYCFQDVLGVAPARYLRLMRLNGAHRDLVCAHDGASVQEVALRWGFWHMGAFASDHKRMFGRMPSQALRQLSRPSLKA